jgi:hypothetical protein
LKANLKILKIIIIFNKPLKNKTLILHLNLTLNKKKMLFLASKKNPPLELKKKLIAKKKKEKKFKESEKELQHKCPELLKLQLILKNNLNKKCNFLALLKIIINTILLEKNNKINLKMNKKKN